MSFISYAQNFEDVMLWRALKHVDQGFYIDVGANDPDFDSVTKAFYERGWRGINVEPVPQWFERLEKARPRDINLQLALGAEPGEITLYEIPDTGLSTAEKEFAERHEAERGYQSRELRVKMDTLASVCERFHLEPIHFLKIDVEGAEKAVFQGTDFGKIRPWIILVEATLPNSQEESYSDWEPLLLNAGYEYVYFDGLNRYYVAGEHENLKEGFRVPPNVFDNFVRSDRLESERRAQEAEAKVKEMEQLVSQVEERAQEAETKAQRAEERAAQPQDAETRAQQAEERAAQAEARAQEAETRARQAEERAAQAEARTKEAETRARQAEERAAQAEAKAGESELKVQLAKASARQAGQRAAHAEARSREVETRARQAEERAAQAEERVAQVEAALQEVFSSYSWRVTQPLRRMAGTARLLRDKAKRLLKRLVAPLLVRSIRFAESRPRLKNAALRWLEKYPRLESRLQRFDAARGLNVSAFDNPSNGMAPAPSMAAPQELMGLSPSAREIYLQLKAAIETNQKNRNQ
jgi:FkbM family methyltransferase